MGCASSPQDRANIRPRSPLTGNNGGHIGGHWRDQEFHIPDIQGIISYNWLPATAPALPNPMK
jgi:hypothetical protein